MDMTLPVNVKPSAILRALADHFDRSPATAVVERHEPMPLIGDRWPEQGGTLVGIIRDGDDERAVIVCADQAGDFAGEWGARGKEIDAKDDHDGSGNTKVMAEAGSEIAKQVLALEVGGHKDWYIPSRQELALCFMHARAMFDTSEAYWSSTQSSSVFAWAQYFSYGGVNFWYEASKYRVRAVRTILL